MKIKVSSRGAIRFGDIWYNEYFIIDETGRFEICRINEVVAPDIYEVKSNFWEQKEIMIRGIDY